MNSDWQAFIADNPAAADAATETLFAPDKRPALLNLDCLTPLWLEGDNALKALQGQITQDAAIEGPFFTDICNPKGRIIASALVLKPGPNQFALLVDHHQASALHAHLNRFFAFFRVNWLLRTDAVVLAGVNGASVGGDTALHTARIDSGLQLALHTTDTAQALWRTAQPERRDASGWQPLLMARGICWVGAELQERFTPHQLNHPARGFVNFRKGCYTGQEIIARMEYKATLKTRLLLLESDGPLNQLHICDAGNQNLGECITSTAIGPDRWWHQAEIRASAAETAQTLHAGDKILRPLATPML